MERIVKRALSAAETPPPFPPWQLADLCPGQRADAVGHWPDRYFESRDAHRQADTLPASQPGRVDLVRSVDRVPDPYRTPGESRRINTAIRGTDFHYCKHDTATLTPRLLETLARSPATALLGPRQAGKTTLARESAQAIGLPLISLDLESRQDRAKVEQPELYLGGHLDKLVILDEVHRSPGLFPIMRSLTDRSRRAGRRAGHYLLLGSASLELLKQSGETLAGRIACLELTPFNLLEAGILGEARLWVRGGFPESLLARSEAGSMRWRLDFIRSYLERDIPQFGPVSPQKLSAASGPCSPIIKAAFSIPLSLRATSASTPRRQQPTSICWSICCWFADRPPWHANLGKRLVKSPKVYVRDTGPVHALLAIPDKEGLLAHPVVGHSWEGFVVENLLNCAPAGGSWPFLPQHRRSGNRSAAEVARRGPVGHRNQAHFVTQGGARFP